MGEWTPALDAALHADLERLHEILGGGPREELIRRVLAVGVERWLRELQPTGEGESSPSLGQLLERAERLAARGEVELAEWWFREGLRVATEHGAPLASAWFLDGLARTADKRQVGGRHISFGTALGHRLHALRCLRSAGAHGELPESAVALGASLRRLVSDHRTVPVVFLSYDSERRRFVEGVGRELRATLPDGERRVLMDSTSFRAGRGLDLLIEEALRAASLVVVFLTRRYLRRPYCVAELLSVSARWQAASVGEAPPRVVLVRLDDRLDHALDGELAIVPGRRGARWVAGEILRTIREGSPGSA